MQQEPVNAKKETGRAVNHPRLRHILSDILDSHFDHFNEFIVSAPTG